MVKSFKEGGNGKRDGDQYLDIKQTKIVLSNIVPKLCVQMTPKDLNAAILLEISTYKPFRGGSSIRKWHTGLFYFHHQSDPKYIEVQPPPDLKNSNFDQTKSNDNIKPFKVKIGTTLYRLIKMNFFVRHNCKNTALFLQPYQDNRWRVCHINLWIFI